ncbi:hypothetical protein VQ056_25155 [Paenibacillus sp. JTLBN-2024]
MYPNALDCFVVAFVLLIRKASSSILPNVSETTSKSISMDFIKSLNLFKSSLLASGTAYSA